MAVIGVRAGTLQGLVSQRLLAGEDAHLPNLLSFKDWWVISFEIVGQHHFLEVFFLWFLNLLEYVLVESFIVDASLLLLEQ